MNSKKLLWAMVFIISSCFIATSSYSSEESSGQFQPISGQTIDIDGDGDFDALTDGLLLLRSMFGLSGDPLIQGVISDNAIYTSSDDIENRISTLGSRIDIDNDGRIDALTDGLLILRYLFGLTGESLTNGVISDGAERASAVDIESYLVQATTSNSDPVIKGLSSLISTDENTKAVTQVNATDADGDTIYYSLSGADADLFSITATGLVSFKLAPDYEIPLDADGDNTYVIGVGVSDKSSTSSQSYQESKRASNTSSTESVSIAVNNVDEDLIDLVLTTTDGTSSVAPTLNISLVIDELTQAAEVQVLTWLVGNTQTWYTATKIDALNWTISETLPNSAASGTYEIRKVLIKRSALDDLTIVDAALIEKGFDIDSQIYNANSDLTNPILSGIDSIDVSGNDGDLSTNIIISIVASVSDGLGEIDKVFSYIRGPGDETVGNWGVLNSDKSKVTFVFSLDPKAASGVYIINDIRLYDAAGNQSFYTNSNLNSLGFESSWTISNTIADNAAPNIMSLSLTPSISASDLNRKQIKIDLTVDDQDSDIRDIYIRLISPNNVNIDQYIVDQSRMFTTVIIDNTYSHTISLPLEYPDGRYDVSYVFVNDQALNNSRYSVLELNALGFNTNVVFGSGNDHAPDISSSSFSIAENQTSIGIVKATDADGDPLTFVISGSDAAEISINSTTGALSFESATDYETKSTYSIIVTVSDGINETTQVITISLTDVDEGEAFTGKVIDGYISGSNVFIDQNFNFIQDAGEYSGITDINGEFSISVDASKVSCLENRPIVANVPVGARDSSLGEVTQAYQMILPSINDTGSSSIVISPFTSLFTEAILNAKSSIKEDLTVDEGCSSSGDDVASAISSRIDSLKSSISNSFGISFADLTSDFIASSGTKVNETAAQNIAKLLPYLQQIDNQVSDGLTSKFGKGIRANVSLAESALDIIFGGSPYEKLPLDFKSIYRTDANSAGWYQEERLEASGAFISNNGILSRADCSETDTELCNISELSLKNISNASTSFSQNSYFYNSNIDFDDINVTSGTLYVEANDSRSWRNNSANWQQKNNRDRECQVNNQIRFRNSVIAGTTTEFQYSSYSQGYQKADCELVRHYYFPILRVSTSIDEVSGNSLEMSYYIHDINRSGISDNFPYDFISNRVNIDPTLVVKEIASLPRTFAELDKIRRMLNGGDYVLYTYHKDSATNAYFEVGTNPRNDMFWDYTSGSSDRLYGQAARVAFYQRVSAEAAFSSNIYGNGEPKNSGILGRIANSLVEVVDYSGSDSIKIPVYPTYDSDSKTMDFSINGASLDLENIHSFIENGINGTPVSANLWYSPDDSISSTVPVKLFLYQGSDTTPESGEGYFSIEFDLSVTSAEGGEDSPSQRTAAQIWEVPADATIVVKYTEDSVSITKNIFNNDSDKIVLSDEQLSDLDGNLIGQPSTLNAKILKLISEVSTNIGGIKNFFTDGGTYTMKVDLASGGHSLIGYYRNTIDYITGTFTVKSVPTYPISVNDLRIEEGSSKDLCFFRPLEGNLEATSFDLSFTQRERPGIGAFADDFSLSSSTVNFAENETKTCIQITALEDTHFDWVHDAYLDISDPSNGQSLSRPRVKISILDSYGYQNRISFKGR